VKLRVRVEAFGGGDLIQDSGGVLIATQLLQRHPAMTVERQLKQRAA